MSECGPCTAYEDRGSVSYVIRDYDPKNEFCQYKVPTIWINKTTKSAWYLVSKEGGNCEWIQIGKELGGFIKQILTQCGTIEPDENGRVEFCAQNGLYVGAEGCGPNWLDLLTKAGLSGGGRVNLGEGLTFSLDFATNEETITGEMETKPISPASLSAKLGEQTEGRFAIGNGKTNALSWGNIVSPRGTIFTFYDAVNKQFNIDVEKKIPTEWREERLEEEAVLADAEDRCIYTNEALQTLTSKGRGVSAHFVIPPEGDKVYRLVSENMQE